MQGLAERDPAEGLLTKTAVDIKVAVKREDLSDIKPLGEGHQGEIAEITRQVCVAPVELGDTGIVLWKQVDGLNATATHSGKQVVLSSQHSGVSWIAKQPEHLSDANR
jgi:hypothetical protein